MRSSTKNNSCSCTGSATTKKSHVEEVTRYDGRITHTIGILVITVTTLIVALAWRDAVDFYIKETYMKNPETEIRVKFWYAFIATVVTVFLISLIIWYFKSESK
jgi:cation transporter-like permease